MNDQVTPKETATILEIAESCLATSGDFVELGCYRGDTSVLLGKLLADYDKTQPNCGKPVEKVCKTTDKQCKTSANLGKTSPEMCKKAGKSVENPVESVHTPLRRLWIYDSFAGLPEKTSEDNSGAGQNFRAGELAVTKREVIQKIRRAGLHNVTIKKAWFDELKDSDLPTEIAFAFLDGDLYSSIKTSLKLVLPRMNYRGIIIVHDYNNPELPGSSRAVDEFLRGHPEYQLSVRHTLAILERKC